MKSKLLGDNSNTILKSISHFRYRLSRTKIIFNNVCHEWIRNGYHDRQFTVTIKQIKHLYCVVIGKYVEFHLMMKAFYCFVYVYFSFIWYQPSWHCFVSIFYLHNSSLCLTLIWHLHEFDYLIDNWQIQSVSAFRVGVMNKDKLHAICQITI
jgi:hypothetical protein